jgi:hypothetical protein
VGSIIDGSRTRFEEFPVTREVIRTAEAPSSPLFSQAIKAGSTLYTSGIVGIDPKTNQVDPAARAVARLGVEIPNVLVSIEMTAVL